MVENIWTPETTTMKQDNLPDTKIVPYVQALNRAGIETFQSCQGHKTGDRFHDGLLWLGPSAMGESQAQELAASDDFHTVCRRYAREDCWEVCFYGLSRSEEDLRRAMATLFGVLGISNELPGDGG